MLPRFLVPDLDPAAGSAALPPEEARHLARVLRLGAGDEVTVFDGRGVEFRARVTTVAREAVTVTLLRRTETARAPRVSLTLVQGVLKPDAMDSVIRDGTMVGMAAIQPVFSHNVAVKRSWLAGAAGRWQRIAVSSAKQCGRSTLPDIREPQPFDEWLATADTTRAFVLAEPAVASSRVLKLRDLLRSDVPQAASLLVGPEGGWTPAEYERGIQAGCVPLTLSGLTFRAEAVPAIAAAALLALWDD